MNLTVGAMLQGGKYVLNHVLSQGKLGITFKATQVHLNQSVVIRTFRPNPQIPIDLAQLKQRFTEDVRHLAHCQHPGLARVLDCFEESGMPFVVMDYIAGQSLADVVQLQGALPEAEAIVYIRQVVSALNVLHHNGLIHRNIKPANLIHPIASDIVILVDCGILHPSALGVPDDRSSSMAGYAAIEHYHSQPRLTPASDIYALAASLYYLVTGQQPIPAPLRNQSPLMLLRQLQPRLSPATETAILSGMELNAHSRPQTAAAWLSYLSHGISAPIRSEPQPRITSAPVKLPDYPPAAATPTRPPTPAPTTLPTQVVAPTIPAQNGHSPKRQPMPTPRARRYLPTVAAIAASFGLAIGLVLRLSGSAGVGSSFFHTEQSFPPIKNWSVTPEASSAPATPAATPETVAPSPEKRWTPAIAPPKSPVSLPRSSARPPSEPTPTATVETSPVPTTPITPAPTEPTPPVSTAPASPEISPAKSLPSPMSPPLSSSPPGTSSTSQKPLNNKQP